MRATTRVAPTIVGHSTGRGFVPSRFPPRSPAADAQRTGRRGRACPVPPSRLRGVRCGRPQGSPLRLSGIQRVGDSFHRGFHPAARPPTPSERVVGDGLVPSRLPGSGVSDAGDHKGRPYDCRAFNGSGIRSIAVSTPQPGRRRPANGYRGRACPVPSSTLPGCPAQATTTRPQGRTVTLRMPIERVEAVGNQRQVVRLLFFRKKGMRDLPSPRGNGLQQLLPHALDDLVRKS